MVRYRLHRNISERLRFFVVLILFGFIAVATTSCKRKGQAKGTVTNVYDGTAVPNIKVDVLQRTSHWNGAIEPRIASGITESNGEFVINYTGLKKSRVSYRVGINQTTWAGWDTIAALEEVYFIDAPAIVSASMDTKGSENLHLSVAPASRVILVIVKTAGADIENFSVSTFINGTGYGLSSIGGVFLPVTVEAHLFPSNGKVFIKTDVTRGGVNSTKLDTIVVKPFGLARHHIYI